MTGISRIRTFNKESVRNSQNQTVMPLWNIEARRNTKIGTIRHAMRIDYQIDVSSTTNVTIEAKKICSANMWFKSTTCGKSLFTLKITSNNNEIN